MTFTETHKSVLSKFFIALSKDDRNEIKGVKTTKKLFNTRLIMIITTLFMVMSLIAKIYNLKGSLSFLNNNFVFIFWISFIVFAFCLVFLYPKYSTSEILDYDKIQVNLIEKGFDLITLKDDDYSLRQAFGDLICKKVEVPNEMAHIYKLFIEVYKYYIVSKVYVGYEVSTFKKDGITYYRYEGKVPYYLQEDEIAKIKKIKTLLSYYEESELSLERLLFKEEIHKIYKTINHPLERIYYEV